MYISKYFIEKFLIYSAALKKQNRKGFVKYCDFQNR